MIVMDPKVTSATIASNLPPENAVSSLAVRRRLSKELNLKSYRLARKPMLSPKTSGDRLVFYQCYGNWTANQWRQVMFSDESTVRQFAVFRPRVQRSRGQRFRQRYTSTKVKHSASVMIWGCVSAAGRGGLWFTSKNTTVKAPTYLSILQQKLPIFMPMGYCTVFQHDGAMVHTVKMANNWISKWFTENM